MVEKDAQTYMDEVLHMKDRQWRCVGGTNEDNRYYAGKLVGNSPEFARGLDSHGFADLKASVLHHCTLTRHLEDDDERKFSMATPQQAWSCVERCWMECAPTSERIVEDIKGMREVLDIIIEHRGTMVPVSEPCWHLHYNSNAAFAGS